MSRGWGRLIAGATLLGILGLGTAGVLAVLAPVPPSPRGPEPGRALFQAHCASCHGHDGRGRSWRARLLLLRPGDLGSPETAALPDQYLDDIIRHGGASLGKPGMPSFGFALGDEDIHALVTYLRSLAPGPPPSRARDDGVGRAAPKTAGSDPVHTNGRA